MDLAASLLPKAGAAPCSDEAVLEWLKGLQTRLRARNASQDSVVRALREAGARLQAEQPLAFPLLNAIHRLIHLSTHPGTPRKSRAAKNLTNILSDLHSAAELPVWEQEGSLDELSDELLGAEAAAEEIVAAGLKRVRAGELVMVYASSQLMEQFVARAAQQPGLSLLLVRNTLRENPLGCLSELPDNCAVIPDTSAPALMHRADRLFTDALAVLADGSLLHDAGLYALCLAAKECAVPVVVLAPLYRFTPLYAFGQETFNAPGNPLECWPALRGRNGIDVVAMRYDHVPADCVQVVVSQAGEFPPPFVYRALVEYYGCGEFGYNFK